VPGPLGAARPFLDVAVGVPNGGRRLRAIVAPRRDPMPAVVWAATSALGSVPGRLRIEGVDPARPDLPALPAIATGDDAGAVDAWLAANPGVTSAGVGSPAAYAPSPPLAAVTNRLVAAGALPGFTPSTIMPAAALHVVIGDHVIATPGAGAGILWVDGRLDITADFAFNGIVAARGGVGVASGVSVQIAGGMWLGAPAFDVAGDLVVRHDRAAIDAAGALFPFPRPATVAGLVDR
jgi:hypothetical protein